MLRSEKLTQRVALKEKFLGVYLGWSPGLRQTVKTLSAVRWNLIVQRGRCLARWRPAGKRRRAMLESNPLRNSRQETHPFDEGGRGLVGSPPHRMDRFPHASENA